MMASSRRPTSRFQPGMAAMYCCTGASPSPLGICGLPPESSTGFFAALVPSCFAAALSDVLPAMGSGLPAGALPYGTPGHVGQDEQVDTGKHQQVLLRQRLVEEPAVRTLPRCRGQAGDDDR